MAALEGAGAEISRADILVASTAAPDKLVTAEHVKSAVRARRGRPMLLVDLGVPRNIDPGAADLDLSLHSIVKCQKRAYHSYAPAPPCLSIAHAPVADALKAEGN